MFMHNGGIAEFPVIKRKIQNSIPDEIFNTVQGNTDSEWAFALFLSKLEDPNARSFTPEILRKAMLQTISHLNGIAKETGITEPSLMNFCVTDGESVVVTRYISSRKDEAASLASIVALFPVNPLKPLQWFSSGTTFSEYAEGGHYKMSKADKRENIIMIASEPLTFERADWMEIKTNNMVIITPKMNLLQIPIVDEFYVPPSDPGASTRAIEFAREKGLLNPRANMKGVDKGSPNRRQPGTHHVQAFDRPADPHFSSFDLGYPVFTGIPTLITSSINTLAYTWKPHPSMGFGRLVVHPLLITAANWWGIALTYSGPVFISMEGLSSLLVAQKLGQEGKRLVTEGEAYQFPLLIGSAIVYVLSAWWIVVSYPAAASSPLASTLLGVAITAFLFLTFIGFVLRRTNIIESSGLSIFIAYNVWLCGFDQKSFTDPASSYAPLLPNILPHFQALLNFIINTLPKPVLFALLYRLAILHLASRILPTIGADSWESEDGVHNGWEDRPVWQYFLYNLIMF
ncbi:hypothetical protein H0H92_003116 [Tricholoma furcatifolium]|nr:hypothetical protein H0H92_003116 [Tricholoma furcatifolium]